MRTTLFLAALLAATCDSPAPQLSAPLDASAVPPDDAARAADDGGSCGAVDASPVDLATAPDMSCASYACGRSCCASPCCRWVPCPPRSTCPDGTYNAELMMVIVGVCCPQ